MSYWVALGDAEWANAARQAAVLIRERNGNETGVVWFQGHWGFQYYMQKLGMHPLDFHQSTLNPGDLLVTWSQSQFRAHLGDAPPQEFVASDELLEVKLRQPVITMGWGVAGFYTSYEGLLPFAFRTAPPEQYRLYRIAATIAARRLAGSAP